MNAFDLHDEWDRYRAEGGRASFTFWCERYGDDYHCDATWLAEDYLSTVRSHEDANTEAPSFRDWLSSQRPSYRSAHIDAESAAS